MNGDCYLVSEDTAPQGSLVSKQGSEHSLLMKNSISASKDLSEFIHTSELVNSLTICSECFIA